MSKRINIDINAWLERKFGEVLSATYPNVRINCPYCSDTKARLYIMLEDRGKKKKGLCCCHNEHCITSFYQLYRDHENLTDFEAMERLYGDSNIPPYGIAEKILNDRRNRKNAIRQADTTPVEVEWPESYQRLWGLTEHDWKARVPAYMVNRKITQEMCNQYLLGYCTGGDFYGRLIIPIYQFGQLVGFQGRAMHDVIKPKYRFMDGMVSGDYLFNLDNVLGCESIILVEGVFDVWGVQRAGYYNVVASFGKHLTEKGVKTISRRFKSVILMFDNDAMNDIVKLAHELKCYMNVKIAYLTQKDPDETDPIELKQIILNSVLFDSNDIATLGETTTRISAARQIIINSRKNKKRHVLR